MIIAHIYIKGQIGDSLDADGNTIEGVKLQDVVLQVEANKDAEAYHVHINSPGGSVNTGRLIADYISKLDDVTTIAETLCGSIATEIHLAVPVANRKIIDGTEYFIHNPLLEGVTGNADELAEASAYVKTFEKEMVNMYVKQTTADKAAIEGLMKAETSLTGDQAETLGFVSEVIPAVALKPVAFYDKPKAKKENKIKNIDMSKLTDQIKDGFAELKAELGITKKPELKSAMVSTDKGDLTWASEDALPSVGDAVTIDDAPAAEGDYVTDDETVISVDAEGNVTEVVIVEVEEDDVDALKAKLEKMKADHETAMEAKDEEFKSTLDTELAAFKKEIGSNFVPKGEKKIFSKAKKKEPLSIADRVAAKKAEKKARLEKAKA